MASMVVVDDALEYISPTDSFHDWWLHLSDSHALPYLATRRCWNDDGC